MLKGDKVVLRPVTEDDLATMWSWVSDIELVTLGDDEPPLPRTLESFRKQINKQWKRAAFESTSGWTGATK